MLEQDKRNTISAYHPTSTYGDTKALGMTDALSVTPAQPRARTILKDLSLLESGSEILLLSDPHLSSQIDVHCVIEDSLAALPQYTRLGYTVAIAPFEVSSGRCAILQDERGVRICVFEEMPVALES